MNNEQFSTLLSTIKSNKRLADKINELGGLKTKIVQYDKLGFDWQEEYVGKKLVKQTYIKQSVPVGTREHPIEYKEGVSLIPNAYYLKNGVRYVYVGEAKTAAEWTDDDFIEL